MFQKHVELGRQWVAKLEKYRYTPLGDIPTEERVGSPEINGWLEAAEGLISRKFGKDSEELEKWKKMHKRISERHEIKHEIGNEATLLITKIHQSMGLLTEFESYIDEDGSKPQPKADNQEVIEYNNSQDMPKLRLVLGVLVGLVGLSVLFLPQMQSWTWLQTHQNRLGLYVLYAVIVAGVSFAIMDPKRRESIIFSVIIAAVLVAAQIIGN
jgi:hypothetical protein